MCAPIDQPPATLADAIGRAHCWSEDALTTPGRSVLSSVWWLSTHLTAADRVVHPVAIEALADARAYPDLPVPLPLRNAPTKLMKDLGYNKGYKWQADFAITPDRVHGAESHCPAAHFDGWLVRREEIQSQAIGQADNGIGIMATYKPWIAKAQRIRGEG